MTKRGKCVNGSEVFEDIWAALEDDARDAANLRARSKLMRQIEAILRENQWTQAEAARRCGITQPRVSELLSGRIHKFSLDALVKIATALGRKVTIEIQAA